MTCASSPTGLISWLSKQREILTLLCCITLFSSREKPTHALEVARRISGAVAGESTHKSRHTKYPSQLLSLAFHYFPFASHFPLPHFTLAVLFASLSLSSLSFSIRLFLPTCFLFACVLVCLLVTMAQDNTKLCDFTNTNNNDFISTPIAPLTDAESCEINDAGLGSRGGPSLTSRAGCDSPVRACGMGKAPTDGGARGPR